MTRLSEFITAECFYRWFSQMKPGFPLKDMRE